MFGRRQRVFYMKITRHTNQDRDELVSGALSALKANPGRVEMIPDDTIETRIGSMNQSALENHAIEAQTGEQDEVSQVASSFCCAEE